MQSVEPPSSVPAPSGDECIAPDIIETRLWADEHNWLYGILQSPLNTSPTFRFPDLISACVSITLATPGGIRALFEYIGSRLVLRDSATSRCREAMWRPQYELLQALQRSAANRHPNPKFQLDQFTTAAVALYCQADPSGEAILKQARVNLAERTHAHLDIP